jgi:hypothetical protein
MFKIVKSKKRTKKYSQKSNIFDIKKFLKKSLSRSRSLSPPEEVQMKELRVTH